METSEGRHIGMGPGGGPGEGGDAAQGAGARCSPAEEAAEEEAEAPGCSPHAGGLVPPDRQEEFSSLSSRRALQLNRVKSVETQRSGVAASH